MDHQRQRQLEKIARKAGNAAVGKTSPVHSMINSSSSLLSQVAKIGINASRSDDNLNVKKRKHTVITEEEEEDVSVNESPLATCDLLKRVIQLGREEKKEEEKKSNNLCATMSLPINSVNDPPKHDLFAEKNLNIPIHGNGQGPRKPRLNSKWGIALPKGDRPPSSRKITNHNGNKYEAIHSEERASEEASAHNTMDKASPEYVAVVMDTEESDLDNTMTPDEYSRSTPLTPDLVQFAKPGYHSVSSQSSPSSCSETNINIHPDVAECLQVPGQEVTPDPTDLKLQIDLEPAYERSALTDGRSPAFKNRTKSVSFDNPSFTASSSASPVLDSSTLKKSMSDNDLTQSCSVSAHDLDPETRLDLEGSPCASRLIFLLLFLHAFHRKPWCSQFSYFALHVVNSHLHRNFTLFHINMIYKGYIYIQNIQVSYEFIQFSFFTLSGIACLEQQCWNSLF